MDRRVMRETRRASELLSTVTKLRDADMVLLQEMVSCSTLDQ
jgi:hypothetical protein